MRCLVRTTLKMAVRDAKEQGKNRDVRVLGNNHLRSSQFCCGRNSFPHPQRANHDDLDPSGLPYLFRQHTRLLEDAGCNCYSDTPLPASEGMGLRWLLL